MNMQNEVKIVANKPRKVDLKWGMSFMNIKNSRPSINPCDIPALIILNSDWYPLIIKLNKIEQNLFFK